MPLEKLETYLDRERAKTNERRLRAVITELQERIEAIEYNAQTVRYAKDWTTRQVVDTLGDLLAVANGNDPYSKTDDTNDRT